MKHKKIIKVLIGITIITTAFAWLIYTVASSNWVYYLSVDEYLARLESSEINSPSPSVRVAGQVAPYSITGKHTEDNLSFVLSGERSSLNVTYSGLAPPNFEPGREIVIEGKIADDGIFHADKIITRCESKYRARLSSATNPNSN